MQRSYQFERCFGFRDLGGYATADGRRVRWGRLFRSMTPQYMTPRDVGQVRDVLGIRAIVDLRRGETATAGPFDAPPFQRKVISFATAGRDMPADTPREALIYSIFSGSGARAAEALEFITSSGEESTALFHCHTGKDRTGVLAAVLLRLLGVSDEDVLADFLLSARAVEEMRGYAAKEGLAFFPELPETASPYVREAPQAAWLALVLEALREPDAAARYLLDNGVSQGALEAFHQRMLE